MTLPAETTHVVQPGETLSGIAQAHYGDGSEAAWRLIYDANKELIGDDPNVIQPGTTLKIPDRSGGHEAGTRA